MMRKITPALLAAGLLGAPFAALAGGSFPSDALAQKDAWTEQALAEPCMNGDVSATGLFHSLYEENEAEARMALALPSET